MHLLLALSILFFPHLRVNHAYTKYDRQHARHNHQYAAYRGTWIPGSVNWRTPRFNTYCFIDDSTVVEFSAVQAQRRDSIVFNVDSNLTIQRGAVHTRALGLLFLFFDGARADAAISSRPTTKPMEMVGHDLYIDRVRYVRAFKYTSASREAIYRLVTEMIRNGDDNSVSPK